MPKRTRQQEIERHMCIGDFYIYNYAQIPHVEVFKAIGALVEGGLVHSNRRRISNWVYQEGKFKASDGIWFHVKPQCKRGNHSFMINRIDNE